MVFEDARRNQSFKKGTVQAIMEHPLILKDIIVGIYN